MIIRLAGNAAVHTVGGVIFGVTAVLAACTVAQAAAVAARRAQGPRHAAPAEDMAPSAAPSGPD
jgi:hypothetical protein